MAVNLPGFKSILSFFTQPGQTFADELHDRLKVIACMEKPNMTHSESLNPILDSSQSARIAKQLKSRENDAQVIFWGPDEDIKTALETIEERCLLALQGVPNETRKALKDGTTVFERVLPGPDRMYPDTDSPPIPILDHTIEKIHKDLPSDVSGRIEQLQKWNIPGDAFSYILKKNLFPLMKSIIDDFREDPVFVGTLIGHTLKHWEGQTPGLQKYDATIIYNLFTFRIQKKLTRDILRPMLAFVIKYPNKTFDEILGKLKYQKFSEQQILSQVAGLKAKYNKVRTSAEPGSEIRWLMGKLRATALGNLDLNRLSHRIAVEKA